MSALRLGYVPLTDAAVLVAACELGFTRREGLSVTLSREASWATLRDRLALGHLDGAHCLAPLAIAATLGLSGPPAILAAPFVLSLNGNAITVSNGLWAAMRGEGAEAGLAAAAAAFVKAAKARLHAGSPLRIGTVFPFSSHTIQLHLFARLGGAPLDSLGQVVVVPPPQMVDALRKGTIDAFCVGAPWNSIASAQGFGRIAALGCELAPDSPEKVMAMRPELAESETGAALLRALHEASRVCADPAFQPPLARLLAEERHLGLDAEVIERTLAGRLLLARDGAERLAPDYLRLGQGRPEPAQEEWLRRHLVAAGQVARGSRWPRVYRPDLYDRVLAAALNR